MHFSMIQSTAAHNVRALRPAMTSGLSCFLYPVHIPYHNKKARQTLAYDVAVHRPCRACMATIITGARRQFRHASSIGFWRHASIATVWTSVPHSYASFGSRLFYLFMSIHNLTLCKIVDIAISNVIIILSHSNYNLRGVCLNLKS